jgi:hypothetical protein
VSHRVHGRCVLYVLARTLLRPPKKQLGAEIACTYRTPTFLLMHSDKTLLIRRILEASEQALETTALLQQASSCSA